MSTPYPWLSLTLASALSLASAALPVQAQHAQHGAAAATSECTEPVLRCATKVTPIVGPDGMLWLAFAAANRVFVVHSADGGKSFSAPAAVTPAAADLDWGPDARPKIAVAANGHIHVAYAIFKDKQFNGQVLHSRSTDGGKTFTPPLPITAVQESQRFETLAFDPNGRLFAAWLDKRNRVPAKARGDKYPGAALAFAWGDGDGQFADTVLAQDNTCECCRIAVGFAGPNRPVVVFRNIFPGGIRDHAMITFQDGQSPGPISRVSIDDWKTDACPHHGPTLAVAPDGATHVAWYTNGSARKGLFYARSTDQGATFSQPMPIGRADRNPTRPALLATHERLHLVWKEFDGRQTSIVAMASRDAGQTWSTPQAIATTSANSDHPLLFERDHRAALSWMTEDNGYRVIPLEGGQ